jgi:hypothetical protein
MSLNRSTTWLAAWILALLMAAPTFGAYPFADMQLFAPPDLDQFGGGPRANEGLFVKYDYLK